MSLLKKGLLVFAVLAALFFATQLPLPFSESLHTWLAEHQNVPAQEVPLTKFGNVDFLRLVNDRVSQNVTVDNNIVVDLYQITPRSGEGMLWSNDHFVQLLGNPVHDASSPYVSFLRLQKQLESSASNSEFVVEEFYDKWELCTSKPWISEEYPEFKRWIESNVPALDKMVAASTKPYYYHPLVSVPDEDFSTAPMVGALLPYAQEMREISRSLAMRAMNHLAEDRVDQCLADLAAIRRIGFKMRQGSTLIEHLIGIAIVGKAFELESQVLSSGRLTAQQCADYQPVITETTFRDSLADCLRNGERLMMLDSIQWMAGGNQGVDVLTGKSEPTLSFATRLGKLIDWRETAIVCDSYFDEMIRVAGIENELERSAEFQQLEERLIAEEQNSRNLRFVLSMLAGARSRGRSIGRITTSLLAPAIMQVDSANIRSKMQEISLIGFEIEQFRLAQGQFPDSLDQLPADIVDRLLPDRFDGNNIRYYKTENGYRLYSVGRNRQDDLVDANGSLIARDTDEFVDDIVIQVDLRRSDSNQ